MNDDISTDLFADWFRPMTATEILQSEGHIVKGDRCLKCWEQAESRAMEQGGHASDHYGQIVYENQQRALKQAGVA